MGVPCRRTGGVFTPPRGFRWHPPDPGVGLSVHRTHTIKTRLTWFVGALLLSLLGTGCARPHHVQRPTPFWHGDQGGGAELVFPGAGVVERVAADDSGWERSRNDERLAARPAPDSLLTGTYPGEPAPSLDDLRVRYLRHNPDAVHYYSRDPYRRRWVAPVYLYGE